MLPVITVTDDILASFRAAFESGLRVRARIRMEQFDGDAMSACITAPPCFPVAPVTKIVPSILADSQ